MAVLGAAAAGFVAPTRSSADTAKVPVLNSVTPPFVVLDGRPLQVTLSGHDLLGVNAVNLAPLVTRRSFTVFNDATILLTLPAEVAPGDYTIIVNTPTGGSDPTAAPRLTVRAASSSGIADLGPPPPPLFSFAPAPSAQAGRPLPSAEASAPPTPPPPAAAPATATTVATRHIPDGVWVVVIGLFAGALAYAVWGSAGRMAMARRQGVLANVVARPVQRLHLGRICRQCGRLHWKWRTRRELWKVGDYCSATCFVTSQDAEFTAHSGEQVASSRLRDVVAGLHPGDKRAAGSPGRSEEVTAPVEA
jgi:hypothetical protein